MVPMCVAARDDGTLATVMSTVEVGSTREMVIANGVLRRARASHLPTAGPRASERDTSEPSWLGMQSGATATRGTAPPDLLPNGDAGLAMRSLSHNQVRRPMARAIRWTGLVLSSCSIVVACQGVTRGRTPAPGPATLADVSAIAPDSLPQGLLRALGVISSPSAPEHPWVRSVVSVVFREYATQDARREAVRLVKGHLVGGKRPPIGEGVYFIQVPDTTLNGLVRVMDTLNHLPQVDHADPLVVDTTNRFRRRPS